ncbi:hypothetical protein ACO0SA_002678 [Hanseniaspora valbyensis]
MFYRSIALKRAVSTTLRNHFLNSTRHTCLYSSSSHSSSEIKKLFNDSTYYKNFNKKNAVSTDVGLFSNKLITSPEGLYKFYKLYLYKCQHLLKIIHQDQSDKADTLFIQRIDNLSNNLCKVIDLCEMVRSLHPNEQYVNMANQIYDEMFEFMNILNTDIILYNNLNRVMKNKDRLNLDEEETIVGQILLDDFNKSGLFMNDDKIKDQFITISSQISQLGQEFVISGQEPPFDEQNNDSIWEVSLEQLKKSLPETVYDNLPMKKTNYLFKNPDKIKLNKNNFFLLYQINKYSSNEELRKKTWAYMNMSNGDQISKLSTLLKLRLRLANLLNEKNFNSYQLKNKLIGNSDNVKLLLTNLVKDFRLEASKELTVLADDKTSNINAWDKEYLQQKNLNSNSVPQLKLNLGSVMSELFYLLSKLYSLKFVVKPMSAKETWCESVRKVEIYDTKTDKIKGLIYLDLFHRDYKTPNASHFTVTTSKKLNDQEIVYEKEDINATCIISDNVQLPIIVINTSIYDPNSISKSDMDTIFHEMGHAMHSILSLTKLQNCSGTRCVADFVELPSILMELFSSDPKVLANVIGGENTDIKLPKENFKALEMIQQIKLSLLDYKFHQATKESDLDEEKLITTYHNLEKEVDILPDTVTNWFGKFGHLFGYGSSYYTYILDRIIAIKIYEKLFSKDPYNSVSGELLKDNLLKYGGSRSPWECLADVFDNKELIKGDKKAIEYITTIEKKEN